MPPMAINQMTMPTASTYAVLDMAQALGFAGVELRNDLGADLFDGEAPEAVGEAAASRGVRIFALAEVYGFNDGAAERIDQVTTLVGQAQASGAHAIVLIPYIAEQPVPRATQRQMLETALRTVQPIVENSGITALIEPLGFANSSLRLKADAVAVFEGLGRPDCFGLVHDTFHHAVAGEHAFFADLTHVVHISGVRDASVPLADMQDAHRALVHADDSLGTVAQIKALEGQGFDGPLSFEAFAPDVQTLDDPAAALLASSNFIASQLS